MMSFASITTLLSSKARSMFATAQVIFAAGDGAIIFCQKSAIGVVKDVRHRVVPGFVISGEIDYFQASSIAIYRKRDF